MLNRLAEQLLRARPQIGRALHATYPFVFVDEFPRNIGSALTRRGAPPSSFAHARRLADQVPFDTIADH